jgi:hypothetical protein
MSPGKDLDSNLLQIGAWCDTQHGEPETPPSNARGTRQEGVMEQSDDKGPDSPTGTENQSRRLTLLQTMCFILTAVQLLGRLTMLSIRALQGANLLESISTTIPRLSWFRDDGKRLELA